MRHDEVIPAGIAVSTAEARADAQSLSLRFVDRGMENAYLQADFTRNHRQIVASTAVVAALIVGFYWLDPLMAPASAVGVTRAFRLAASVPSAACLLAGAIVIRRVGTWRWLSSTAFALYLLKQSLLLVLVGAPAMRHFGTGLIEGLIGLFFVSHLPVRQSSAIALMSVAVFLGASAHVRADPGDVLNYFVADAVIVLTFCAFSVYRYEKVSRAQFIAQRRLEAAFGRRLAAEADRRRWLEVFADFLGHELKNTLIGVSSSIELASRLRDQPIVERYFDRARRSLDSMRRLLQQVTAATSLESALERKVSQVFDLATVLADRIDDFRDIHPARRFELAADRPVWIDGDPDALLQLIDKLLANAVEHGDASEPIGVTLVREDGRCRLAVSDIGDALPGDTESIFSPFVTRKDTPRRNGNLGLGLFVARTIAHHHGGSVTAEPLAGARPGACFTVILPRLAEPPVLRSTESPNPAG